jgi:peptidoglycan hydrolase-like protein with peptidoglycan-binding domain
MLIAEGHMTGEATGYFGSVTKSSLSKWQAKNGLPATGYFGPMTRAQLTKING